MKQLSIILSLFCLISNEAQNNMKEELPYKEIPEIKVEYSAGSVLARMIDGLGFRFYWATEGLRVEDLNFKPSEEARTTSETIDHIYGLSKVIYNSAINKPNGNTNKDEDLSFEEKRKRILIMLQESANIFRNSEDLNKHSIVFKRDDKTSEYPMWNQINGPIADALWHCGQVVSFRRASGNPYNSKASLFTGKLRE
ncbi:MAG: hypothetical protein HKO92_12320 [Flavobacteriaceae bacterium]|nr:hypothetical protein [Bacteroidia bacterium]NNK83901.1 hypothetical protein [Flavobacteriaceae bacterium]